MSILSHQFIHISSFSQPHSFSANAEVSVLLAIPSSFTYDSPPLRGSWDLPHAGKPAGFLALPRTSPETKSGSAAQLFNQAKKQLLPFK